MDPPALAELSGHRAENVPRRSFRALVEQRHQSRSSVLGIHIDRLGTESLEGDRRGSQAQTAVHCESAAFQKLREHLGQKKRFSERLRGDDDGWALSQRGDGIHHLGEPEPEDGEAGGANPPESSEPGHAGVPSPARWSNCRT